MNISTNDWEFFILEKDGITMIDPNRAYFIIQSYWTEQIINGEVAYTFTEDELYNIAKKESVIFELNNKHIHKHLVF